MGKDAREERFPVAQVYTVAAYKLLQEVIEDELAGQDTQPQLGMIDLSIYTRSTQEDAIYQALEAINPLDVQGRIRHVNLNEDLMADFFVSLTNQYGQEVGKSIIEGMVLGIAVVMKLENEEEEYAVPD